MKAVRLGMVAVLVAIGSVWALAQAPSAPTNVHVAAALVSGGGAPTVDCGSVTCRYVRQGAAGSGTGLDWTNAYAALPSTLVRGTYYLIADGAYAGKSFNTAASGTTLITVRKATTTDHGTATGWSAAFGDGQATFPFVEFTTPYWVFDGIVGDGSQTTAGATASSYGFGFAPAVSGDTVRPVVYNAAHIQIRHTAVTCPGSSGDIQQFGYSGTGDFVTASYTYVNNCQVSHWNQGDDNTIEYSYFGSHWSSSANHGVHAEQMARPIFRFNLLSQCPIQCIEAGGGSTTNITDGQYYNNIIVNVSGTNGFIKGVSSGAIVNTVIYNNTMINASGPLLYESNDIGNRGSGNVVRNNLCYLCAGGFVQEDASGPVTHSHNTMVNSGTYSETGGETLSGNPFVDYTNGNYRPDGSPAIGAGFALAAPYNVDFYGVSRTTACSGGWCRGAVNP